MREAYVGLKPCGCIEAASVIEPDRKNDVARFVRDLIKDGVCVEVMTCEAVRTGRWWCETCQPSRYQTALFTLTPTEGGA